MFELISSLGVSKVKAQVRIQAYSVLREKVDPRALSIQQRIMILRLEIHNLSVCLLNSIKRRTSKSIAECSS